MLSFQCQVLLFLPGRDRLHSGEIRRSTQPKLRKIPLPKPWQPEQEPESQCQPQSQQFPWPRQRISPLLTSSQPLSLSFLNLSTAGVLPLMYTFLVFTSYKFPPDVTNWFFFKKFFFTFLHFMSRCPCGWTRYVDVPCPFPSPLSSFSSSPPFFLSPFSRRWKMCCVELQKCWVASAHSMFLQVLTVELSLFF